MAIHVNGETENQRNGAHVNGHNLAYNPFHQQELRAINDDRKSKNSILTHLNGCQDIKEYDCSQEEHDWSLREAGRIVPLDTSGDDEFSKIQYKVLQGIEACVHDKISEVAEIQPTTVAVASWDGRLSYKELDRMTDALANHLHECGVSRGTLVPLCFEKSMWTTVSMISVLKAGGAVVPLDAAHPVERLLGLVEEVSATIVLTGSQFSKIFVGHVSTIISDVPTLIESLLPRYAGVLGEKAQAHDPAFVLFTSGSTGKPKGLIHTHKSICSSVAAYAPALNLTKSSRVLQFAAYSFDISVIDTVATLIQGGCLCVPSEHERLNDIINFITKSRVNWAFLTPSFARQIDPSEVQSLTNLVLGGERVTQDIVQVWSSDQRRIFNGYGPAECAICITKSLEPDTRPAIGRGVGCNTWIVDIDDYSKLAPPGVVGELLVEGPTVFEGYLNDGKRTREAFLDSPTWLVSKSNATRRLYKTGDLVQQEVNGDLFYMGRRDTQIKIRGQRVELGEIEHQIRSFIPGGSEVAVEYCKIAQRQPLLIAFVTDGHWTGYVRSIAKVVILKLANVLPSYMVPSVFIPLPQMPMSRSGKLDRQKLRNVAAELPIDDVINVESDAPEMRETKQLSTSIERRLAALWARILNLQSMIHASDHFFLLGGNSLSAICLVTAARRNLLSLTVADIFLHPHLADMAAAVSPITTEPPDCRALSLVSEVDLAKVRQVALRQNQFSRDGIGNPEDIYPCTSLQEGLFALSLAQPGVYIAQIVYDIPTHINLERFRLAWDSVIDQYAILRTCIIGVAEGVYQVVKKSSYSWQNIANIDDYLATDRQKQIQYGDPLLRLGLTSGYTAPQFVLTVHHSIFDGWALHLIWREVERAYTQSPLIHSPGFNSFVHYMMYDQPSQQLSKDYWSALLTGSSAASFPSLLSASHRPQADASLDHRFHLRPLDSEVTLSIVIRAAWALLLAQYSNTKDITFGLTLSGRFAALQGIEDLIGPTITSLPIRTLIDPSKPIRSFLKSLQDQATEMIPFEQTGIQDITRSCSDAQTSCKFSSLLVVHPEPESSDAIFLYEGEPQTNMILPHALVMECHLVRDGVYMTANYDSTILWSSEVRRLLSQFEHILRRLWEGDREVQLREVELMSPADTIDVISRTQHLPPAEEYCIHERFEVQARLRPMAEAVCAWDGTLTYRELDSLSIRLASHLVTKGIGPEVIVPLCFNKSKWTIVALVAVLKAGGACLFLEPSWPKQRIDFIIKSVRPTLVVAESQHLGLFDVGLFELMCFSPALFDDPGFGIEILTLHPIDPDNAAFLMFTSGSTGTPKGIVQEHRSLFTSAFNHASMCNINSGSRVLQFSAFTFDVYQIEICTTLTHGGCVCIPSEHQKMNILASTMEDMRVNWAFFTPTFCRSLDPLQMPHLKTLLVGGEAVDSAAIEKWVDHVLLLNCYGPAECGPTVMCKITPDHRPESIGSPLCCASWIVDPDDHQILSPFGAIGELLLEGYTMARGYLDEPQKTAASFISPPHWLKKAGPSRGPRLYKTGDLVRYSRDGSIDYIGRKDTQVKVRGQRVELGEVEHHLRNGLPVDVDAAAETVHLATSQGRSSLVAFVCLKARGTQDQARILDEREEDHHELALATEGLKSRMESSVPASMVPSAVLLLSRLPINTSGKLDRKQLKYIASQIPAEKLREPRSGGTRPQTPQEKILQSAWEKVLPNLDHPVVLEDHFFHLGADSITAMTLVAFLTSIGYALSVEKIFKHPVFAHMAAELSPYEDKDGDLLPFGLLPGGENQAIRKEVATICKVGEEVIVDVYPCTPLQEGISALSTLQPGTYISQNVYCIPSSVDLNRFRDAWEMAIKQHPILRTRIIQTSSGTCQVVVGNTIEWQVQDDLDSYIKFDKGRTMTDGDPLFRLALCSNPNRHAGHDGSMFVMTLHHSIYDGWSLKLLWETVRRNYFGSGTEISPSFGSFIKFLLNSDAQDSASYWQKQLTGGNATAFPEIVPGYKPLATSFTSRSQMCSLPLAKLNLPRVTFSTLVRAAWSLTVAQYSSTHDVTFGVVTSGRTAAVKDIERLVAPIITTLPVRVRVNPEETVIGFVEKLQSQAAEMLPHEHVGLQNIKQYLDPASHSALDFQNLLVIQPAANEEEAFPGVTCLSDGSDFTIPHALIVICTLSCDGVQFQASYDPHLVEADMIQHLLSCVEHILIQLTVREPLTKLSSIDLLPSQERQEILAANVEVPQGRRECVHDIIQQRIEESPGSTAICSWDGEMSYGQLNDTSSRLSTYLITRGVGPGWRVPVLYEKSLWVIVIILSIMKAGAAFVLIDQSTAVKRIETIIRAVNARVALCSGNLADLLKGFNLQEVVIVNDIIIRGLLTEYSDPLTVKPTPEDILYVNFTSGTTSDIPKAAVIEHKAYATAAIAHATHVQVERSSRVLQFASYSFDGAVIEILTPLMNGACVCIPSEKQRLDNIPDFIVAAGANLAFFTPTVARATLETKALTLLKTLILVGESVTCDDISRFEKSGARLLSGYGITECCVCSSIIEGNNENVGAIGRPIASNFWVTDSGDHNRLAPQGAIGELLIEGPVLAREYLNDIAKTKASFINDPAWSKELRPMRLYKTGDLVRYSADGKLNLIGRKDVQVKLRGQRVDLPEIERLIKRWFGSDDVDVACNLISPNDNGNFKALAAFVCFGHSTASIGRDAATLAIASRERTFASASDLKAQLLGETPFHMIPTFYIPVTQVPITRSGKIDRRKLSDLAGNLTAQELACFSVDSKSERPLPDTEMEVLLAQTWSEVLNIEQSQIAANDSFFSWADSIQAIRLVAALRQKGQALAAVDISTHPILSDMATLVQNSSRESLPTPITPFALVGEPSTSLRKEVASYCKVEIDVIEDIYPCTPLQEGLMALSVKSEGSYIARTILSLPPSLENNTFMLAWTRTIDLNPILRTRIVQTNSDRCLQVVLREPTYWNEGGNLTRYLTQDRQWHPGFGQALNRFALISEASQRYLVWTSHHATYDGWAVNLIFQQVEHFYRQGSRLEVLPFNNYLQYLDAQCQSEADDFWRAIATQSNWVSYPPLPELSYKPSPTMTVVHNLELISSKKLSSVHIFAAWALVTARHADTQNTVFGTILSGRTVALPGIERVVGPTISSVPFCLELPLEGTVGDLLEVTTTTSSKMASFAHRGLQNIRRLGPEAEAMCDFQTILVIQPDQEIKAPCGTEFAHDASQNLSNFNNYGLMLEICMKSQQLTITASLDEVLIGRAEIESMLRQFDNVLQQLVQCSSNTKLSEISLVSKEEIRSIVYNQCRPPLAQQTLVQDLIKAQVSARKNEVAIESWDGVLTYARLDDLSSRLATFLAHHANYRQSSIIPICFEKSYWAVVCVLGVLKAGGAVMLLDPANPLARLHQIIKEARAELILCDRKHALDIKAKFVIEVTGEFLEMLPVDQSLNIEILSSSPAFIISTSGSTGKPKLIIHTHEGICHSISGYASTLKISQNSRILQFAAYSFDISINEILAALFHGGCLCIPSESERLNNLASCMRTAQVTWLFAVPSFLLHSGLLPEHVPCLETLVLGGEPLGQDLLDIWSSKVNLMTAYGPAECQICTAGSLAEPRNIGHVNGCISWIVDSSNVNILMPIGMEGELIIQGPVVAHGYLNAPDEAFRVCPDWLPADTKSSPLYKTGDLVKYNADGSLAYFGRVGDTQAKIRGQRLDLCEVEYHSRKLLPSNPKSAAVVVDVGEHPYLVLFVSGQLFGDGSLAKELRDLTQGIWSGLRDVVPSYMIPGGIIYLDEIPVTASGKTDRRKLQAIKIDMGNMITEQTSSAEQDRRPLTPREQVLQSIWAEILKVEASEISANSNFLRLGGDSIQAIRLVTVARAADIHLTVSDIFEHPKLHDMATLAVISTTDDDPAPFSLVQGPIAVIMGDGAAQCKIQTDQIEDMYPCTPLQEGLFALSQKAGAYIARSVFELPATIDLEKFKSAWQETTNLNAIMRTSIVQSESNGLLQVVTKNQIPWNESSSLEEYIKSDTVMQLGDILTRFAIVEGKYLVLSQHHATYDGFSLPHIFHQTEQIYKTGTIDSVQAPYSRFVKHVIDQENAASLEFWAREMTDAASSPFPASKPDYQPKPSAYRKLEMGLLPSHGEITTATLLRSAWALVISNYVNSADVTIGVTLSGRQASIRDIEKIRGPTITTVPVRVTLDMNSSIEHYLKEVQQKAVKAIPYEQFGLQNIKKTSSEAKTACNFENLLIIHPAPRSVPTKDSIHVPYFGRTSGNDATFRTYGLNVECTIKGKEGITLEAFFDSDLLDEVQMMRILGQFQHVVKQLSRPKGRMLRDLEVISPQDKEEISAWNAARPMNQDKETCVHHVIALQSRLRPAVCSWDGDLTYEQLEKLSSRLAYHLLCLGITVETMVPVCFEKSLWTIVAVMAVMKAGGCFVSLDPSHPRQRLQNIIQQTQAPVVLTSRRQNWQIPGAMEVCEESLAKLPQPPREEWVNEDLQPGAAVYCLFTSGSTGLPKGVVIEHGAFCAASSARRDLLRLNSESRVLQFSSYSFDVSVEDILSTLMAGGCICIPSEEERLNDLSRTMRTMGVNFANLTPSVASLLRPEEVPDLKVLALGGEPMTEQHVLTWSDRVHLINFYGPTECSVTVFVNDFVTPLDPTNIGRSVGCTGWIVQAENHNTLAPIGSVGELLIEGPVLARGYLHDVVKTKSAFIENPHWAQIAKRLYKTGDIVRYNSDGTMTYIGRKEDTQVKIRGQRVELGEIEHHLRTSIPDARTVAVDVLERQQQTRTLAAFVSILSSSSETMASKTVQKLKLDLQQKIPAHMVPKFIVMIDQFPLTLAGKVDRRKLRALGLESLSAGTAISLDDIVMDSQQPTSDLEKQMQSVWAEILNLSIDSIGVNSPFFALGGDSITAIQVVGKYRSLCFSLTTYDILQHKTIYKICQVVQDRAVSKTLLETGVPEMEIDVPFNLSPMQREHFLLMPEGNNSYQQSFLLKLQRQISIEQLKEAMAKIVHAHSLLRSLFTKNQAGHWVPSIQSPSSDSYVLQHHASDDTNRIRSEVDMSINIEKGQVIAVSLIDLAHDQMLYITAHHLVIDLVSWRIILRDLEEALSSPKPSCQSEVLSFSSWCRLLYEYAGSQWIEQETLPFDVPNMDPGFWGIDTEQNTYENTNSEHFIIDERCSRSLLGASNDALHTKPVEIFLAAVLHSFCASFPDRGPPLLLNEGHGREPWDDALDLSRSVGWFTTMYPLAVENSPDIVELVLRTKDARRSIPKNGLPYFTSRHLNSENKPLEADIIFNYQGQYQQLERKDALFQLVPIENPSFARPATNVKRPSAFEVSAIVHQGQIRFDFVFNRHLKSQERVLKWITRCRESLKEAAERLVQKEQRYTLSDFPLLSPHFKGLNSIIAEVLPQLPSRNTDIYPCSAMQRKMFMSQLRNSGCYKAVTVWKATSQDAASGIDADRLSSAWQKVVDLNSILRTCIVEIQSQPIQIVLGDFQADRIIIGENDQALQRSLFESTKISARPLSPMHQMTFTVQKSGDILCKLEMSHVLMDGASMGLLLRQLASIYEFHSRPPSNELTYKDYIHHLQTRKRGNPFNYWKTYLGSAEPCIFPTTNFHALYEASHSLHVDLTSFQPSLHTFCKDHSITISTLFQTIWSLVLRHFTQQDAISFGYLVSGRDIPLDGIASLIGPVFNLLPCCVELSEDMTLIEALNVLHADSTKSSQHHDFALPEIREKEDEPFNTLINFRKYAQVDDGDKLSSSALSIVFEPVGGYDPFDYDIVAEIAERLKTVSVVLTYWKSKISPERMENVVESFRGLLGRVLEDGQTKIKELAL